MKNHKGAIATLLTLGLVVVGTLITLGTSLFVSNKKTNLASNSMAYTNPCNGPYTCPAGRTGDYYSKGGTRYADPGCYPASALSWDQICKPSGGSASPSNTPTPGGGSGGGNGGNACSSKNGFCEDNCSNGNWGSIANQFCRKNENQNYCCKKNTTSPTVTPTQSTGGDEDYPDDDSCWIVKCFEGKPNYVMYSDSLSRYEIPLSSCPNNSLYEGGGWMTIGVANRDAKLAQLGCENGNEEITLAPTKAPTKVPTKPPTDTCVKHVGFKCSSGGYTGSTKTFDYYKSTAVGCSSNTVGGSCYGTSTNSCSIEWNAFLKSQCSPATGGGTNCTDADYSVLADIKCGGADNWCGPQQRKYQKPSNNTCTSTSQFKCKNDNFCNSNPPASESCTTLTCPIGFSGEYYKRNIYYYSDKTTCESLYWYSSASSAEAVQKKVCIVKPQPPGQGETQCEIYKTVSCNNMNSVIYNKPNCTNKSYSCFGSTLSICDKRYADVYADICGDEIPAPATVLIVPPNLNPYNLGTGQMGQFIINVPVVVSCKPVIGTDYSCQKNYPGYRPDITNLKFGEFPTQCCPTETSNALDTLNQLNPIN